MFPTFMNEYEEAAPTPSINLPFSESYLFPILTAGKLLASAQRQKIINDIKTLSQAPEEYYQSLYKQLIDNFVEFVQVLPVTTESRMCGIMDEGLLRALFILEAQKDEDFEPIVTYALFSAALIFDIGNILENRIVVISDEEGGFVREWYPFAAPMKPEDQYYKIRRDGGMQPWLCRRITPLLARQIMPQLGFDWLANDPTVFSMWLALLLDDREAGGILTLYWQMANERLEEFKSRMATAMDLDIEIKEPKETSLAEDFMKWLKKSIKSGKVAVSKPKGSIHVIKKAAGKGMIIKPGPLIKQYAAATKKAAPPAKVVRQLMKIGVVSKGVVKVTPVSKVPARKPPAGLFKPAAPKKPAAAPATTAEGLPKMAEVLGIAIKDMAVRILTANMLASYAGQTPPPVAQSIEIRTVGDPKKYVDAIKALSDKISPPPPKGDFAVKSVVRVVPTK